MKNNVNKQKQIRYTLEDCLINQRKLSELLKVLIQENRALQLNEKEELFRMLPKALLTQGANNPVSMVIDKGWFTYASVQNLALRAADLTTDKVQLNTTRPEKVEVTILISDIWQFLYDKMLYYFPLAASEALHLSGENIPRTEQGSYSFSSSNIIE
jgi:hypothetical protein